VRKRYVLLLALIAMTIIPSCGGGGSTPAPQAPIFSSAPGTEASQDQLYSYQVSATDPSGGAVTFFTGPSPQRRCPQR
jgi:hypothetical protein